MPAVPSWGRRFSRMSDAERRKAARLLALDPANSVAVEACAGSGKTWLLTARLLRLLLAGVRPGEILAITYTRKAAREIEARLRSLLAELAGVPREQALSMLVERGLTPLEAEQQLPRARSLFETVLRAEPAATITTFHGWFARLLSGAPLESGLAGRNLEEAGRRLFDEAWDALAEDCARDPQGALASALLDLYQQAGASNTRALLRAFCERRAEWELWCKQFADLDAAVGALSEALGAGCDPLQPLHGAERLAELEEFARLLGQNTVSDQAQGNELAQAVLDARQQGIGEDWLRRIASVFLTAQQAPRARKPSAAQAKRLGDGGENRLLALHSAWSTRLIDCLGALQDCRNARFNAQALRLGDVLLARLDALKRAQRVMDFADLEAEIDQLLAQEGSAAWLQARLDARYRHILLDEFQDTNPLQWRILRGWLDAYQDAGMSPPGIFLVGDPKQSIYRFRRAEPRLFTAAAGHFEQTFGAVRISNAHTFRNAQGIVDLMNAVFEGVPGFERQTAERVDWPSRVELLPLVAAQEDAAEVAIEGMRQPLTEPRHDPEDLRRAEEAAQLASRIRQMVGCWRIRDAKGDRPARFSDILILTRRKTQLSIYEGALRAAGIPFVSPGQGGLLDTLEAQDLLAVLRFLADPGNALALAHALRSPAFAVTDEDLLALSAAGRDWWPALRSLAAAGTNPRLVRAGALLEAWLEVSAHLPAHDLIDRIFHESDWFARTRAVLPAVLWPGVQANLEALLALALDVDGGRYPSLTRLVDKLSRLSQAEDEAPDEGLIAAGTEAAGGRVRVMTIHAAKGLEAPIVWLIDAHAPARRADGYTVLLDWPAGQGLPGHFSVLGRSSEIGPLRGPLLEAEAKAAEREELNLLYVAISRAEQVFIASGIAPARATGATTHWSRLAAGLERLDVAAGIQGGLPEQERAAADAVPVPSILEKRSSVPRIGSLRGGSPVSAESNAGIDFGAAMHAWLEAHHAGWPLPEVAAEVRQTAEKLLARPTLQRFFDPGSHLRAGNETALLDAKGQLRRIDRWVEFDDAVWVLDYKSGQMGDASLMQAYREQLADYVAAMRAVFPHKPLKAMLIFTDGGECPVE
ncbi:MAG: ATP-dependent exodnase subunit beta [Candidatus Dactylopiibacterium carminicum]|uniref:DNA 3'-5' helicase n=2 Tax=Candidatus Dactylopiibacterium carminicum TaxID=857335 RepID=A0A272EU01_9RHOO|nr:ATP-dependent exodnase subunit beta [Candidatus Dactylopiibacterium carminicum]PAS93567.1 MAG: ATP-dependent exodnase subunit beta [Candidatus Dactylopiibacterium carminicum]